MIKTIQNFQVKKLYDASIELFDKLGIEIDRISSSSIDINDIFTEYIGAFKFIEDIYAIGMISDNYFYNKTSNFNAKNKKGYQGILLFAVDLSDPNPTRKILADISRAFNKEYHYTPVIVIFKYGNKLSLSNTQRQPYKIKREGEKVGKVIILRDIDIDSPHTGHIKIIEDMKISNEINSYEELYNYWQKVFDIELLQEKFYSELFIIFENLVNSLIYPQNDWQKKQDFIVRLIGRMLFLKFLIKKGVVPQKKFEFKEDYYHFVLEPLFFEILNKPIDKRDSLLLEEDDTSIPFLNGGLFEPYKEDYYSPSFLNSLKISDKYLQNLLNLFDKYYFTIDENTSLENEVGLDPELLGMVFENLIGYINPETKESARKQTGSFYTPREIVDFMVSNSILEYLKTKTTIQEDILKDLIFYHNSNEIEFNDKIEILKALYSLKILDPACGSGAFPMGLLNKIVEILNLIDIDAKEWLKLQSKKFKLKHQNKVPDYIRKLSIIQNSIFGIDIQPIAVEIAKLRFFLSLLVDEDRNKIEPLPNMEFKIVCANTLLPLENISFPKELQNNLFSKENLESNYHKLLSELKKLKKDYFYAIFSEKDKIKKEFNIKLQEIVALLEKLNIEEAINNKLHSYNPFEVSNSATFFDNEYMFNLQTESFDIIIGNPPYIRQEKIKPLKNEIAKINKTKSAPIYQNGKHYLTYNGTADIYVYFFEKGYQLLEKDGIVSFITSNKYTRAKYGKNLRDFLLSNTKFLNYLDFNGVKVFKRATVDTSILTFKKDKLNINSNVGTNIDNQFIYCDIDRDYTKEPLIDYISKKGVEYYQKDLSLDSFSFSSPTELKIKKQIEKIGTPLKKWDIKINYGIKTGFNEAFIIDGTKKDELIAKDPKSAEIIKPILRGRDIKKYSYEFADKWIIGTFPALHLNIDNYPAIKEYLKSFGKELEQSGEKGSRKKTNNKWFETQDQIAYWREFEKEKIIYNEIGNSLDFCLDKGGFYCNNKLYFITSNNIVLTYLTAILNSSLLQFYFSMIFNFGGGKGKNIFQNIPIPKIPKEKQKPFEILVDYIIFLKQQNLEELGIKYELMPIYFEQIIDGMVYELYFEDLLKKHNRDIIQYVDNLVDISDTPDEDKLEIIKKIFDELNDLKHPVRNNLFYMDSIPEIRLVKESK